MPNRTSQNLQMLLMTWQFNSIRHHFCLLEGVNLIFLSFYENVHFFRMKVVAFPDLTVRDISLNNYNDSFGFMSEIYWGLQIEWKTFACSDFQKACRNWKFNEVFVIIFRNMSSFNKNITQPQLLWTNQNY